MICSVPKINTRKRAGIPKPPKLSKLRKCEGVVLHCTAGRLAEDEHDAAKCVRRLTRYHMNNRGYSYGAYHFAVDNTGGIWEIRGWGVVGAHCANRQFPDDRRSMNFRSHGFVFLGSGRHPTDKALDAFRYLISERDKRYGFEGFVSGHRDFSNKACPGDGVYEFVRDLGRQIPTHKTQIG